MSNELLDDEMSPFLRRVVYSFECCGVGWELEKIDGEIILTASDDVLSTHPKWADLLLDGDGTLHRSEDSDDFTSYGGQGCNQRVVAFLNLHGLPWVTA